VCFDSVSIGDNMSVSIGDNMSVSIGDNMSQQHAALRAASRKDYHV